MQEQTESQGELQNEKQIIQNAEELCSSCQNTSKANEGITFTAQQCGHQNSVCKQCCSERIIQNKQQSIYCTTCKQEITLNSDKTPENNEKPQIEQSKSIQTAVEAELCQIHEQKLQYFCLECNELCCMSCAQYGNHINHNVRDLLNAFQIYKPLYDTLKIQLKSKTKQLQSFAFRYQETSKELRNHFKQFEEQVNQITNSICQMFQDKAAKVIQQYHESLNLSAGKIEVKTAEIEQKLEQVKKIEAKDPQNFQLLFQWIKLARSLFETKIIDFTNLKFEQNFQDKSKELEDLADQLFSFRMYYDIQNEVDLKGQFLSINQSGKYLIQYIPKANSTNLILPQKLMQKLDKLENKQTFPSCYCRSVQIKQNKLVIVGFDPPDQKRAFKLKFKTPEKWKFKKLPKMNEGHLNCQLVFNNQNEDKKLYVISGRVTVDNLYELTTKKQSDTLSDKKKKKSKTHSDNQSEHEEINEEENIQFKEKDKKKKKSKENKNLSEFLKSQKEKLQDSSQLSLLTQVCEVYDFKNKKEK